MMINDVSIGVLVTWLVFVLGYSATLALVTMKVKDKVSSISARGRSRAASDEAIENRSSSDLAA